MIRFFFSLRFFILGFCALCLLSISAQAAEGRFIARKLVALYDSRYETNLRDNTIHRFLGLPANRLGYEIIYQDINQPLPQLGDDIHGILVWFHHEPIPQIPEYINWLAAQLRSGKHLVVMENLGIGQQDALDEASITQLKFIYERIGIRDNGAWHPLTYKSSVSYRNPLVVDFERRMNPPLPPYGQFVVTPSGTSHMRLAVGSDTPGEYADVIATGPQGGYVASGYAYHEQGVNETIVSSWYINPFTFLRFALNPPQYPVPDATTRNGRRIFYSHIDGDGWNNRSHIEGYSDIFSSRVILEEILKAYPDFAFSVGIVAGDVMENCFGSKKSREIAVESLALPNVEATSHTYTHPLYWQFFENYTPEKESVFNANYPKPAGLFSQDYKTIFGEAEKKHSHDVSAAESIAEKKTNPMVDRSEEAQMRELLAMYDVPRSYNCIPFDEHSEIMTAKEIIESLAPEGKKVKLMQWSGNTSPYERFLRKTREAGMYNINGGESRYDAEYPSYSTLYPIGINLGNERQIYSTASNENTYTNLWSERFFGYRYLIETVRHTERPIRVAPFNVYFHSYSGERPGSLRALKEIMDYARKHELIPLMTSHYAAIANGFYSARIEELGRHHWRIHNRGELQTLRFALPSNSAQGRLAVDMRRSKGVLGQRMVQENLYIFLNPSVDKPEIMLIQVPPEAIPPLLVLTSSRWDILSADQPSDMAVHLQAQGYGRGEMQWQVPRDGIYEAVLTPAKGKPTSYIATSENNILNLAFDGIDAYAPVDIRITFKEAAQ